MKRNRMLRALWPSIALAAVACGSEPPTSPDGPAFAKGAAGGGPKTSITVTAADPDTVPIGTTLAVRILGSGFGSDATVEYALAGVTTTKVTATSVSFISSTELLTTTTVAADAPLTGYDIAVTSGGKRGIGVEKLTVVAKEVLLPQPGGVRSSASDVNDDGIIVGSMYDAADNRYAMRWTPEGTGWRAEVLGTDRSASRINRKGEILRVFHDGTQSHTWVRAVDGGEAYLGPGTSGQDLSDDGTVIGVFSDISGKHIGVWSRSGSTYGPFVALPVLSGYVISGLNQISANGRWIAGYLRIPEASGEWPGGWERQPDGSWLPFLVDENPGTALAVNSQGQFAGATWPCLDSCSSLPVFWPGPGQPFTPLYSDGLGYAPGYGRVGGMNDRGDVVGLAYGRTGRRGKGGVIQVPALWARGGPELVSLGKPGTVHAINNTGLAVGVRDGLDSPSPRAAVWILP